MASSLSRSAYSDAFLQDDSPARVGNLLRARLAAARETNDRLAEFIAERAELEEAYAAGLQRSLSKLKTGPSGKTPFNLTAQGNAALGAPSARSLERSIDAETQKLAKIHAGFAKRCRDEIEVPLRQRSAREDWQSLSRLDKQTESLLKDVEDAQSKVQKAQGKSGGSTFGGGKKSADKLASLVEAQSRAEAAWKNHVAGSYFQQYQSVDYARLNTLKELMTVFETLQNDLGRERMETAERGLEAALTWEVDQELAEFVSSQGFRSSTGAGGGRRIPGIGVTSPTSTNLAGEFGARDTTTSTSEAQRPRANTVTSSRSIRSNGRPASIVSSTRQQSGSGAGDGTPQKSGGLLSAFKVGSRLDRRKSTAVHSQTQLQSQAQGQAGAGAGAGARPSLQSNGDDEESLRDRERQQSYRSNASSSDNVNLGGGGSEDNVGALRPSNASASKKSSNRTSFMPSFGLGGRKNSSRGGGGGGAQLGEEDEDDERSQAEQLATPPATATASNSRSLNPFSALTAAGTAGSAGDRPLSQASDATSRPMNTTYGGYGSDTQSPPASATVDSQGFSVPPAGYDRPLGGTSTGGEANLMDMGDSDNEDDVRSQSQNMRVSIAPVAPLPKSADDSADREAMLRLKNTLLSSSSSSSSSPGGPLNRRGTRAGRGSRQSTLGLASPGATPGLLTPSPPPPGMPRVASDDIPIQTLLEMHKQQQGAGAGADAAASDGTNRERTATAGSSIRSSGSPTEMLASPTFTSMTGAGRAGSILSTSSSQQNLAHAASSTSPSGASSSVGNIGTSTNGTSGASSFRAAILETVSVLLKAGEVQRVMITGEIIFSARNLPQGHDGAAATLRIPNFSQFDKHAPNGAILAPASTGVAGEYTINTAALQATQGSNTTVFKYQLDTASLSPDSGSDSKAFVPLEFTPQWKIEERQTSFLMAYSGNPGCRFRSGEVSPFGDSEEEGAPVLQDVSFSVPVSPACGGVSSLQTKPQGSYSSEKRRILWKMDELNLGASGGRVAKVLARFATESEGAAMPVSVQWRLPGRLASGLQLEVEGGGLKLDEVVRNTQSGKYVAQP